MPEKFVFVSHNRLAITAAVVSLIVLAFSYVYLGRPPANELAQAGSTACLARGEGALILRVLKSSSERPISSVPVKISHLVFIHCGPFGQSTTNPPTMSTNGSGLITVRSEDGAYYLQVEYLGTYRIIASIEPARGTCVTLEIPSGKVNIEQVQLLHATC